MDSSPASPPRREVKLVLLGPSGVGKTSLVLRFQAGRFDDHSQPTIGASFTQKDIVTKDKGVFRFKIWDTAGQEKFRGLTPMYFRGAQAAILVYDVTQPNSLRDLDFWVKELRKQTSGDIVLAVAANKSDMTETAVPFEDGEAFAAALGAQIFKTSAKTNLNVSECFEHIASKLPEIKKKAANKDTVDLLGNDHNERPNCGC